MSITIDIEKMTIGDLELLDRAGRSDLPASELVAFLDRVTLDDVRLLPITMLPEIVKALTSAVDTLADPETAEGN